MELYPEPIGTALVGMPILQQLGAAMGVGVRVLTDQCGHPESSGERKPCTPPVSQCEVIQGPANFPFCLFQTEGPAISPVPTTISRLQN